MKTYRAITKQLLICISAKLPSVKYDRINILIFFKEKIPKIEILTLITSDNLKFVTSQPYEKSVTFSSATFYFLYCKLKKPNNNE